MIGENGGKANREDIEYNRPDFLEAALNEFAAIAESLQQAKQRNDDGPE